MVAVLVDWGVEPIGTSVEPNSSHSLVGLQPVSQPGPIQFPLCDDLHDPLSFPLHGQLMLPPISSPIIFLLSLSLHFRDTSAQDPSTPRCARICPKTH